MTGPDSHYMDEDPFSAIKKDKGPISPPPREVAQFHNRSDVDAGIMSQHHTLGIRHVNAAYGDHSHNNKNSVKIGTKSGVVVTGSRAGNAALASLLTMLANFIEFTDNTTP